MSFGSALHTYLLEPERFDDDYIVAVEVDKRTKEYKSLSNEAALSGREIISGIEFAQIQAMTSSLRQHPLLQPLFAADHIIEKPIFWKRTTGLECKCKPDLIVPNFGIAVDFKTCADASIEAITRSVVNYSYELQSAVYLEGLIMHYQEPYRFLFAFIEKEHPHHVNLVELSELFLDRGRKLFSQYDALYQECMKSGNFYGYEGREAVVNTVVCPNWHII